MNTEFTHIYFPYAYLPQSKKSGKKTKDGFNMIQTKQSNYIFSTWSIKQLYPELRILLFRQDVQPLLLRPSIL